MNNNFKDIPPLSEVIEPALHDAFLKAAERAKQTRTYLVIQRNHKMERIPYNQIDAFVAEQQKIREIRKNK